MVTAVALFSALAVLLLWGLSLQLQGQLREQVLMRAEMRSQQLADAMGEQVSAQLSLLDLGLLDLRADWDGPAERFKAVEQRVLAALPEGLVSHLTVVDAAGQWREPASGRIVREPSKLLLVVLGEQPTAHASLAEIIAAYKQRFSQQSVLLLLRQACFAE